MLPSAVTYDEFLALRRDPARHREAVDAIAARHGITPTRYELFGGSNLVVGLDGEHVLKLFPPLLRFQWEAERIALGQLAGRLSVAIPALLHEGELDGWPYVVLSRLRGATLEASWPGLSEPDRVDVLHQIGALMAEVQQVALGRILDLEPPWRERLGQQRAGSVAHHRQRGLPSHLIDDLDRFLDGVELPFDDAPVLLTGEYTPENLLIGRRGRPILVGMLDFGDVTSGPADYDLLGPSTFLGGGERDRVHALVSGHGAGPLTPERRTRLMALQLLHRHSELPAQIRIDGWKAAPDLDALAALIWPLSSRPR